MGAPAIPSQLPIPKVQDVFGENGELIDKNYERRADRFFDEFEWYVTALSEQRKKRFFDVYGSGESRGIGSPLNPVSNGTAEFIYDLIMIVCTSRFT